MQNPRWPSLFTILSEVLLKRPSANNAAKTAQNKRIGR